jgi:hypothetical protein
MSVSSKFLFPSPDDITHYAHFLSPPLGAFLAYASLRKLLTRWEIGWAIYRNNGFTVAEYRNTAIIEVISALGLLFPLTRLSGVITLIAMIIWIRVETKRRSRGDSVKAKSPLYLRIPARITEALLVGLAWALWPRFKG